MKRRKMDPRLVSMQKHELAYIRDKFRLPIAIIRRVIKKVGRSRIRVYAELRCIDTGALG